jgi:glycosyltransferase involved in cell wall biosynthesis
MSDLLVSFVVPAYNEEALIPSCLASIRAEISRTGCRAEIIVVNNNSTDRTAEIASSIPGVVIVDEPQRGLVQARRAGYMAATGRLIANIDADTMLTEGWLQTALAEFDRRPNLVALSGPFIHYDLPAPAQLVASAFYRGAFLVSLMVRLTTKRGSMMQGGNFIVSKRALDAAGGFNTNFRFYGEDTELARRLSKIGDVRFSFALRALSSGRRFAAEGLSMVALRYSLNYLWATFCEHPFSPTWLDFRHSRGASESVAPAPAGSASTAPARTHRFFRGAGRSRHSRQSVTNAFPPATAAGAARGRGARRWTYHRSTPAGR